MPAASPQQSIRKSRPAKSLCLALLSLSLLHTGSAGAASGEETRNHKKSGVKQQMVTANLGGAAAVSAPDSLARLPAALEFELQDQHGISRSCRFPASKIRVVTFADQKGTARIEGWVRPLYQRYRDRIEIHGVAMLSAVPVLARGLVSGIIKASVAYPVLLDWDGRVTQHYNQERDAFRLVVIDEAGRVHCSLTGAANKTRLQALFASLDALLAAAPAPHDRDGSHAGTSHSGR